MYITNPNSAAQVICLQYHPSPCGELVLASVGNELCLCDWNGMTCAERNMRRIRRYINADFLTQSSAVIELAKKQLDRYFAGSSTVFDIPLHPFGTDFQLKVWNALLHIPYAETRSYLDIAHSVGNTSGVRAVAQAIGANGIGIIIPCHRGIGSNRSLTGFAGGLDKKAFLLEHERINHINLHQNINNHK